MGGWGRGKGAGGRVLELHGDLELQANRTKDSASSSDGRSGAGFSPHHQAILPHQRAVLQLNSVLILSTWRELQSDPQRLRDGAHQAGPTPTSAANDKSRVSPCFRPTSNRLQVPMVSSLGSMNLLELLREIVCSLDHRFITTDSNSRTA